LSESAEVTKSLVFIMGGMKVIVKNPSCWNRWCVIPYSLSWRLSLSILVHFLLKLLEGQYWRPHATGLLHSQHSLLCSQQQPTGDSLFSDQVPVNRWLFIYSPFLLFLIVLLGFNKSIAHQACIGWHIDKHCSISFVK
jgi:hypothetical protein